MNRLKLNADKTQLIWLGIRQQLAKLIVSVSQLRLTTSVVEFASTAKDLGMVLDNPLSMESQVTAVCRSCFYQLRQVTTDFLVSTIPRSSLHPLPAGLLQRSTHWDSQGPEETTTSCSECRTFSGVWGSSPCHYCATFIGCQWDSELSSKLLSLFGNVSMALLQSTCKSYALKWTADSIRGRPKTTVCVSRLIPATMSANVCCTTELCLQRTGSVEQSVSNTARQ